MLWIAEVSRLLKVDIKGSDWVDMQSDMGLGFMPMSKGTFCGAPLHSW